MSIGHYRHKCEPARTVCNEFGGAGKLAKLLNISPSVVSRWCSPKLYFGTGGFIPLKHWWKILDLAHDFGLRRINRTLLCTGRREKWGLGKAQKIKGDRFEYQIVHELNEAGFKAHRVPLSGAVDGYEGDILVDTPTGMHRLQCKISGTGDNRGKGAVVKLLREVAIAHVVTAFDDLMAMRGDVYIRFLRGEKLPPIINLPEAATPGRMIHSQLHKHHALLFRVDGKKEWYVLVLRILFDGVIKGRKVMSVYAGRVRNEVSRRQVEDSEASC